MSTAPRTSAVPAPADVPAGRPARSGRARRPAAAPGGPGQIAPDHVQARQRLIQAALRLFAEVGFARASTRAICEAAGVNLSAIRYYFGDKFGLYRAAFHEPICSGGQLQRCLPDGATVSPATLRAFFRCFLAPLEQGADVQRVTQLHYREMVEPTGVWQDTVEAEFKPEHRAFARMLAQEFGLAEPDVDVHRLVFAIFGMGVHFFVGQPVIVQIQPQVLADAAAVEELADRLAGYALGMIAAERRRRRAAAAARGAHR